MIKKEIYPKTKRVSCVGDKVYVTEKLDGSNLVMFDGEYLSKAGVIFTIMIFAIVALIFLYKKVKLKIFFLNPY